MRFDITRQRLPAVYKRGGKACYLDPVRKKLVEATPEETVRQKVLAYLVDDLSVPVELIWAEVHLSRYGLSSKRRADIIVHGANAEGELSPIAVIECKAPGVLLGDKAAEQLTDYCNALGCDFAMLVNDRESYCYHYDERQEKYIQIEALPPYDELVEGRYSVLDCGELPARIPHESISEFLKENPDEWAASIGAQTGHSLACAAFNLLEGLLDPRHRLPAKRYDLFTLLKDCGVRALSYGNASGGSFDGLYRTFIVEAGGSTELVSIGLFAYVTAARPDTFKTVLNVAIDNEKTAHHALQLVLDDAVEYSGKHFTFFHHGRIAVGHRGSGRIGELRTLVNVKRPQLICGKAFLLGSLVDDRLWALDDPELVLFVENLISYALIRDEYRAALRQ